MSDVQQRSMIQRHEIVGIMGDTLTYGSCHINTMDLLHFNTGKTHTTLSEGCKDVVNAGLESLQL